MDTADNNTTELQKLADDGNTIRHDTEVAAKHGLSHLEEEFLTYAKDIVVWTDTEIKAALAWIASKL